MGLGAFVVLVFPLFLFKINIIPYFGLAEDYEIVRYSFIYLTRFSIIIPIFILIFAVYHFEKSDLLEK